MSQEILVFRSADPAEAEAMTQVIFASHRLELTGLQTDPLDLKLSSFMLGTSTAGMLSFGTEAKIHLGGTEAVTVIVTVSGSVSSHSMGNETVRTSPEAALIVPPGTSVDLILSRECSVIALRVPATTVDRELERLLGRSCNQPVEFGLAMDLTTIAGQSWRTAFEVVAFEFESSVGFAADPTAGHHLERLLVAGLLLGHPHTYTDALKDPVRSPVPLAVRHAIALLEAQPTREWSTLILAHEVFISVRALQEGFQREVGLSPMSYLREVRLGRAHDELTAAARGSVTVNDIARRWGFQHTSRFAGIYRARFGTTPSSTLHKSPPT